MEWTIINSIDLAKIYPITKTKVFVTDSFLQKHELVKFFDSFGIPYYIIKNPVVTSETIYFGSNVDFKNLYILAGIAKSYGFKQMIYKSSLKQKITFGSIKRKTILTNNIEIRIDEILNLAFDSTFEEFSTKFNFRKCQKINLQEYYLEQGWQMQEIMKLNENVDLNDETDEDEELDINELLKKHDSNDNAIDPHENFHWGGMSGEEAYIGYWNTE